MPSAKLASNLRLRVARKLSYARRRIGHRIAHRQGFIGRAVTSMFGGGGHFILVDYPTSASNEPRYGYGRPPHLRLAELLGEHDEQYAGVLQGLTAYTEDLRAISLDNIDPREPCWRCGLLFGIDGASLYGLTRQHAPRAYLEIGSGNSTLFVDRARRDGAIDMKITSIDPYPRREIDAICDVVIRQPLESADLTVFDELQPGDMVFFDGSHRVFMNSDAVVFFLDVLPRLPPGVLVGIHDIHLPDDYRPEHADRYYTEQYLLASYLLGETSWLTPVLPCWYVSRHPQLGELARSLLPPEFVAAPTRVTNARSQDSSYGVICWLRTGPRARASSVDA
jgi:predicted O-methyltransferase YrrM